MDGGDLRSEGYRIETRELAGECRDTMPQIIEVTVAEGRRAAYVPLGRDGKRRCSCVFRPRIATMDRGPLLIFWSARCGPCSSPAIVGAA